MLEKQRANILLLLCAAILCLSSAEGADYSLWQPVQPANYAEDLARVELPDSTPMRLAVRIDSALFSSLRVDDTLQGEILPGQVFSIPVLDGQRFVNGDQGWRGGIEEAAQSNNFSLTVNANTVLGTLNIAGQKYFLRGVRSSDDTASLIAWVYSTSSDLRYLPADDGGRPPGLGGPRGRELMELVSGDVTIEQTITPSIAVIGQEVSVSIAVTNNLGTTLQDEQFHVLFTSEVTDLLSSNSACALGSTGVQAAFVCPLPDIAPAQTVVIDYVIRPTEAAYPQVDNAVFVGDIFGEVVRDDSFINILQDTLTDSDGDGLSNFNEALLQTDPLDPTSREVPGSKSEIDLMFLYTQDFLDDLELPFPETKINQMVQVTNGYFADSGVDVVFRPVYYGFRDYDVQDLDSAFDQLRDASHSAFAGVPELRERLGADVVILLGGLLPANDFCGLGTLGGQGLQGEMYHPLVGNPDLYVTQYLPGSAPGLNVSCSDDTLAHELGHKLGLGHSTRDPDSNSGALGWSRGHGVDSSFSTIMARESDYPGSSPALRFSDPASTACNGLPCGVDRAETDGADAVFSLNLTRHQVAARRDSRLLPILSLSETTPDLIMFGGATRNGDTAARTSQFVPSDTIDVRATLAIPSEHQGQMGVTYIVIVADGLGFFYRDHLGGYVSWDGELATLGGSIEARPLNAEEELVAFSDFVPADFAVDSASLTVFFAYALSNTDIFVYSAQGVPFTISP